MSDGNFRNRKTVLLAGIAAAAILAAVIAANQMQSAAAQQPGNSSQVANTNGTSTLSTSGTATAKVQPDKFIVTAGVTANGTSAEEAVDANAELMADVIDALVELDVAEEQIATNSYQLVPVYAGGQDGSDVCITIFPPPPGCEPGDQVITGYRVTNTVSVTLDVNGTISAGSVVDTAVEAGANTVDGVSFFISTERQEEIRDSLMEDAINSARSRADIATGVLGMEVTGVQSVNTGEAQFPLFSRAFESAALAAATQFQPGQQEVSTTVNITFYIDDSDGA
ncbi:MAG: SIMPL domain-containing protein [Nitrososphaera sp.]|uniref:SIMPL domain-containing protein n=1 Tax=Nitrososphaera sp. TaxID=1971748 RepID=UPI003D6F3AE2